MKAKWIIFEGIIGLGHLKQKTLILEDYKIYKETRTFQACKEKN